MIPADATVDVVAGTEKIPGEDVESAPMKGRSHAGHVPPVGRAGKTVGDDDEVAPTTDEPIELEVFLIPER
jgi:hypothetical protein